MEQESSEKVQQIHEAIVKLKAGTATNEDVLLVKDYISLVKEMLSLFEESVKKVQYEIPNK
jgi:hypothetical protein